MQVFGTSENLPSVPIAVVVECGEISDRPVDAVALNPRRNPAFHPCAQVFGSSENIAKLPTAKQRRWMIVRCGNASAGSRP